MLGRGGEGASTTDGLGSCNAIAILKVGYSR